MGLLNNVQAWLAQLFDFETRPDFQFIRAALTQALQGRLSAEDSEGKTAVVIGDSLALAQVLGLRKTKLLILDYPDFTVENLALLSDNYDFVIADRALHQCGSAADAGRETVRVLRPGGWFVHTTCLLDVAAESPFNTRRFGPSGLSRLFPHASAITAGGWGKLADWAVLSWVVGRKPLASPDITPAVATRAARRRWYRFHPRPSRFGVVAIARNEAPYLLEWIAHYRLLGFDQITIYDNQSNDASAKMISRLAKAGIINAVYWRDRKAKQRRAYNDAARRLRPFLEWCLFVDIDEFLILEPGLSLENILPGEPDVSAVGIPWRVYGSGGMRNRGTGLTIERFTMATAGNTHHVKSLVRLRDLQEMSIHIPKRLAGRIVDIGGSDIGLATSGRLGKIAFGAARINHYFNRSWEEFECKRARGRVAGLGKFHSVGTFDRRGPGEVETLDALRLVPALKEEVGRLRKIVR